MKNKNNEGILTKAQKFLKYNKILISKKRHQKSVKEAEIQ